MKAWWTARELALQTLPGLPSTKRKINVTAAQLGWATRANATGQAMARAHKGRGGGVEYHVDVLPFHAREVLIARGLVAIDAESEDADINALLALAAEMRTLQVASRSGRSSTLVARTRAVEEAFDRALKPFRVCPGGEA